MVAEDVLQRGRARAGRVGGLAGLGELPGVAEQDEIPGRARVCRETATRQASELTAGHRPLGGTSGAGHRRHNIREAAAAACRIITSDIP